MRLPWQLHVALQRGRLSAFELLGALPLSRGVSRPVVLTDPWRSGGGGGHGGPDSSCGLAFWNTSSRRCSDRAAICCVLSPRGRRHETLSREACVPAAWIKTALPLVCTAATHCILITRQPSLCHSPVRGEEEERRRRRGTIFPRHVLKIKQHCTCSEY